MDGLPPAQQPWSGGAAWRGSVGRAWLSAQEPGSPPQLQRAATAVRCRGPHLHHHRQWHLWARHRCKCTGEDCGEKCSYRGPHLQHQTDNFQKENIVCQVANGSALARDTCSIKRAVDTGASAKGRGAAEGSWLTGGDWSGAWHMAGWRDQAVESTVHGSHRGTPDT